MYCSYRGGFPPRDKYGTKYTSPLRVFDNFNSKVKTLDAVNFAKIKNSKSKASRSPLTQSRVLLKENTVNQNGFPRAPKSFQKAVLKQ